MTATDGDKDRPENIVYFLTGQGIDTDRPDQSKFDINKTTGEIFVLKVGRIFIFLFLPNSIHTGAYFIKQYPNNLYRLSSLKAQSNNTENRIYALVADNHIKKTSLIIKMTMIIDCCKDDGGSCISNDMLVYC